MEFNKYKNIELASKQIIRKQRIILFDLATGGHHPSYIRHLVNYWCDEKLPFNLDVVVSPKFIESITD
jgi:hypothetical protein